MAGYISPNAGYVPNWKASGQLMVDFSRNVNSFALPRYVQYVRTEKQVGYYLNITPDNAGRIINTDLNELRWPDGNAAPGGNDNQKEFSWVKFSTDRYAKAFTLGDLTINLADFDIVALCAVMAAQQMMTARTLACQTVLTTSGNWPANNTATATAAGGGQWDLATSTNNYIKRGLMFAANKISLATLGAVQPSQMMLVINPRAAELIGESQEMVDQLKQQSNTMQWIKGESEDVNKGGWGLPPTLYGFPVVVENTVRVSTLPGSNTQTKAYVLPTDSALLVSRVGGLDAMAGTPSFSTIQLFMQEEMTVETYDDVLNRRTTGRVVENFVPALVAPASGFLFTSTMSVS